MIVFFFVSSSSSSVFFSSPDSTLCLFIEAVVVASSLSLSSSDSDFLLTASSPFSPFVFSQRGITVSSVFLALGKSPNREKDDISFRFVFYLSVLFFSFVFHRRETERLLEISDTQRGERKCRTSDETLYTFEQQKL